jgi:murein DD-endopeptidase MepM/ murein hydrolase activator NlpD
MPTGMSPVINQTGDLPAPMHTENLPAQKQTDGLSMPTMTGPLTSIQTSTRLSVAIHGKSKGHSRTRPLQAIQPKSRRKNPWLTWMAVLVALTATGIVSFSFSVPLGTSQGHYVTLSQVLGNLLTTGQSGLNTAGHYNQSGTPTLLEGLCGGTDIWGTCAKALLNNGTVGTGNFQPPIKGATTTQPFGQAEYQLWCGCWKPHSGIDLAASYYTPITAADTGEVIWVGWDWSGLGWAVKISHGNYISTIYGHMADYVVKVGQYVNKGDLVGHEGSTGASTGPHLHFMVLINNSWVNPANYMTLP